MASPTLRELVRVFARIGCINVGGPAGQIALLHRLLVDERRWLRESEFLHALNFCHLLPGPEAQQLATYIGWKLHGIRGGLVAGTLFVLPGAALVLALSMLYVQTASLGVVAAVFLGVKAAVLAIVVQAVRRLAARSLDSTVRRCIALAAFIALAGLDVAFPWVVIAAGLSGALAIRGTAGSGSAASPWTAATVHGLLRRSAGHAVLWTAIWLAPLFLVWLVLGGDHVLVRIGGFFATLAAVSFGGAYAVLAYMAQEAVQTFGWLQAGEMADGLGLAESTPGPLVLVTQFVGYLAAYRHPQPLSPALAGLAGAALTTWVIFLPSFLWIFCLAPWIDRLQGSVRLRGALAGIGAAVVGVIANLALWFAWHVLFAKVELRQIGPLHLALPEWSSFQWPAALLAVLSAIALMRLRWNILAVLAAASALSVQLSWLGVPAG
jgi:chromate transporter